MLYLYSLSAKIILQREGDEKQMETEKREQIYRAVIDLVSLTSTFETRELLIYCISDYFEKDIKEGYL